jgi:Zn-finger nucleic acid-binding protein
MGESQAASNVVLGMSVKGCSSCGGFLIDYNDAEKTIEKAMASAVSPAAGALHPQARENLTGSCPFCGGSFAPSPLIFELTKNSVHLDQCNECQGIWFDRGELAEIFEYATREAVAIGSLDEDREIFSSMAAKMKCPRCAAEKDFGKVEILGIDVAKCTACKGIWMDAGDLTDLLGDVNREISSEEMGFPVTVNDTVAEGGCPRCQVALKRWTNLPAGFEDLYVDLCPHCLGMWFDKGEFKQILALFSASPYVTA